MQKQRHKEETFGRLLLEEAVTPSDLDTEKKTPPLDFGDLFARFH